MELHDKSITAEESLHLIQKYISRTKENLKNKSFDFLFWGTLVATAALCNYVLLKFIQYNKPWLPWPVLMIGGTIFSFIYHAVTAKRQPVTTYTDRFLMWLSISAAAVYFLIAFLCVRQHISPLPFMFAHTSVLIFVTGAILRIKPVIIGGILFFVAAVVAALISYENQLLLTAAVTLVGYLIPGILLRNAKDNV